MKDQKKLEEMLKRAEKISGVIKDQDLRSVAFGKVIDFYMGAASSSGDNLDKIIMGSKQNLGVNNSSGKGPKYWIEELISENHFKKPIIVEAVKTQLLNRGHNLPTSTIQVNLNRFVVRKRLRRVKQKEDESGNLKWHYVNW